MQAALDRMGLDALAYAPFRSYFTASFISNSSMFLFMAGLGWHVQQQTNSASAVGIASFIYGLPWLLFMAHAGILTDRIGARPLVAMSLALSGVACCILGLVALAPEAPFAAVLVLAFGVGSLMALGGPGFISIVNDLVPPGAVSSAVSLNFLGINIGRIFGGIVAGLMLAAWPAGVTIFVAGILQAAPSWTIWRLSTPHLTTRARAVSSGALRPLVEAASYAARYPTLGVILLLSAAPGAIGLSYNFLLPVAAVELGIGADGLGLLLAVSGVGGLLGGLSGAFLMREYGHGRVLFLGLGSAAGGLAAFGVAAALPVALVAMAFVAAGFVIYASASLSLIQALSPAPLRGRLTGLFTLLYWGLMPIGGLLGGQVAEATSARFAFAAAGTILLGTGALAVIGRRQVVTLRVSVNGRGLTGDLRGSGAAEGAAPSVEG